MNQSSQNNLCHQIQFDSIQIKINLVSLLQRRRQCNDLVTSLYLSVNWSTLCFCVNLVSLLQRQVDENQSLQWASWLVSLLQRRCQCNDLPTHIASSISESIYLMFLRQIVSLLQWLLFFSHSESATIDISMIWKINRKINRKTSIELYVSTMNYITSHRDMTFKEKKVMLQSVSTLNRV